MDQIKTGKFISQIRKEKGLTQKALAEKIGVSDKTISKWETGKGLPEVSLMIPLCDELNINVNELLSGEIITDSEYKKKAEENIMQLIHEKQDSKKKIIVSFVVVIMSLLSAITMILVASYIEMDQWIKLLLIIIGVFVLLCGIMVACVLDINAGTYECPKCGKRFVPTTGEYLSSMHTFTKRYLKCPNCGEKNYCKKKLTH